MGARFGSFEKPRGKILRNHSISLRDRSDSETEGGWRNTPKTISIRGMCHNDSNRKREEPSRWKKRNSKRGQTKSNES